MKDSAAIQTALEAANSAILLNSAAQISRAAKAWRRCDALGVDTEFVRERTYFANIGLVQVSDGQTVWLVDPLIDGAVEPLKSMLDDHRIRKIVHSPSEDLEVLQYAVGAIPEPMIDTQQACAMLGQPLQMGYHTAAEWLLDVAIDKDQTRSNWCARPLKHEQLRYAALDVCLLPMMWQMLQNRLEEAGRLEWLMEDCSMQLAKARQPLDSKDSWQRIRGHGRLDGQSLAILQSLASWREGEAKKRNLPRGFIIPDLALLNISRNKLDSIEAFADIDGFHPRAIGRHGHQLVKRIQRIIDSGKRLDVVSPLNNAQRRSLAKMRSLVQDCAAGLEIEPALLAAKKDLEAMVINGGETWPERLAGWRQQILEPLFKPVLEQLN